MFRPTVADIDPATGAIWLTDGYGCSGIHRFNADLQYEASIVGPPDRTFNNPHWLCVDCRADSNQLLVCDRRNHVIEVFDAATGHYLRRIGEGQLITPSCLARYGEHLLIRITGSPFVTD